MGQQQSVVEGHSSARPGPTTQESRHSERQAAGMCSGADGGAHGTTDTREPCEALSLVAPRTDAEGADERATATLPIEAAMTVAQALEMSAGSSTPAQASSIPKPSSPNRPAPPPLADLGEDLTLRRPAPTEATRPGFLVEQQLGQMENDVAPAQWPHPSAGQAMYSPEASHSPLLWPQTPQSPSTFGLLDHASGWVPPGPYGPAGAPPPASWNQAAPAWNSPYPAAPPDSQANLGFAPQWGAGASLHQYPSMPLPPPAPVPPQHPMPPYQQALGPPLQGQPYQPPTPLLSVEPTSHMHQPQYPQLGLPYTGVQPPPPFVYPQPPPPLQLHALAPQPVQTHPAHGSLHMPHAPAQQSHSMPGPTYQAPPQLNGQPPDQFQQPVPPLQPQQPPQRTPLPSQSQPDEAARKLAWQEDLAKQKIKAQEVLRAQHAWALQIFKQHAEQKSQPTSPATAQPGHIRNWCGERPSELSIEGSTPASALSTPARPGTEKQSPIAQQTLKVEGPHREIPHVPDEKSFPPQPEEEQGPESEQPSRPKQEAPPPPPSPEPGAEQPSPMSPPPPPQRKDGKYVAKEPQMLKKPLGRGFGSTPKWQPLQAKPETPNQAHGDDQATGKSPSTERWTPKGEGKVGKGKRSPKGENGPSYAAEEWHESEDWADSSWAPVTGDWADIRDDEHSHGAADADAPVARQRRRGKIAEYGSQVASEWDSYGGPEEAQGYHPRAHRRGKFPGKEAHSWYAADTWAEAEWEDTSYKQPTVARWRKK